MTGNSQQADQEETVCITRRDWFSFEQQFIAAVQELKLKRSLLTEAKQEVQQIMMQVHEKDALLDRERREAYELRINLSMMTQTVQKWEEERKTLADSATRSQASLDIAVAERDFLKDKVHNLQLEVVKLRSKAEENERQLTCLQDLQSSNIHEQAEIQSAMDKLKGFMKKVKEDHSRISRHFERTNELATKLKLVASQLSSLDAYHSRQVKSLEEKLIASSAELDALKIGKLQKFSSDEVKQSYVKEWEESMKEMRSRLSSQAETIAQLNATLGVGIEAQRDLQAMDTQLRTELTHLKAALEAEKVASDCLKARLDKSAEQLRESQHILKQERELHKRPENLDFSTQTLCLVFVDKQVMTDTLELPAITNQVQDADLRSGAELDVVKIEHVATEEHIICDEICCRPTQVNQQHISGVPSENIAEAVMDFHDQPSQLVNPQSNDPGTNNIGDLTI